MPLFPVRTLQEIDDELYKDIKRGDWVLYWEEPTDTGINGVWFALVMEVHDVRTLTLVIPQGLDVYTATADDRERAICAADGSAIKRRVPRFDRSTSVRHLTWCGID